MNKFIVMFINIFAKVLAKYVYKVAKEHLIKYKDNKAIEKVEKAETEKEFDNAAEDIANRF